MTTDVATTFACSICGEPSTEICVYCTKDACGNHRCERCKRCSDCCECEVPLSSDHPELEHPHTVHEAVAAAGAGESALPLEPGPLEASETPELNSPPARVIEFSVQPGETPDAEPAASDTTPDEHNPESQGH